MPMKILKRSAVVVLLLIFTNYFFISALTNIPSWLEIVMIVLGALFFLIYAIFPGRISGSYKRIMQTRIKILCGGCELLQISAICLIVEIIIYLMMWSKTQYGLKLLNGIACILLLFLLAVQGVLRLLATSAQVKISRKILLLLVWGFPVVNLILIRQACRTAMLECEMETQIMEINRARKESHVCQTRYPVLMVHGVFFRDWHYFNYWGRIPKELIRNGAVVYYGKQQSALAVKDSAEELKNQILEIIAETGCSKVNIIAHSKGGLDARYAVSCLGMAPYVASLTTINTPHHGCRWVDEVLEKVPDKLVKWIAGRYNKIFRRLGDCQPDFYSSVYHLTENYAQRFNEEVKNQEGILYQSVMSKMDSAKCAGFPLNITYRIINKFQRCQNDGLVPLESGIWGEYLGLLRVEGRRGISHGDMIDLFRENIKDFDDRNFYVRLICELKRKGF